MRLFVSVDLPRTLAEGIAEVQDEFEGASGLDFVDPEQAHVTLKFLGEVPERRLERVESTLEQAVSEAEVDPFEVEFSGVGAFPNHDYIKVVWLGVDAGAGELTALHESIEDQFVEMGFEPEDHEFTPHVTLARMKHAGGKDLVQELLDNYDPSPGTMQVEDARLKKSELGPGGPEYSTVHSVPLD